LEKGCQREGELIEQLPKQLLENERVRIRIEGRNAELQSNGRMKQMVNPKSTRRTAIGEVFSPAMTTPPCRRQVAAFDRFLHDVALGYRVTFESSRALGSSIGEAPMPGGSPGMSYPTINRTVHS